MSQPLLLLIVDILSVYDIFRTFRTKDIATESTVMSPSDDRKELLLAGEAMGGLAVLPPLLLRL